MFLVGHKSSEKHFPCGNEAQRQFWNYFQMNEQKENKDIGPCFLFRVNAERKLCLPSEVGERSVCLSHLMRIFLLLHGVSFFLRSEDEL